MLSSIHLFQLSVSCGNFFSRRILCTILFCRCSEMARPSFSEINSIFAPNPDCEKHLIFARFWSKTNFFPESLSFSLVMIFGTVVVVIVVTVLFFCTGRRAGKNPHCFTLWLTIPQREQTPFFLPNWLERPIWLFAIPLTFWSVLLKFSLIN